MSTYEKGCLKGIDYNSPLVKYRGEKVSRLVSLISGKTIKKPSETLAADIYYALYLPAPVVNESSEPSLNKEIVESLVQTNTGLKLRSKTTLDKVVSTIAASIYIIKLHENIPQPSDPSHGQGLNNIVDKNKFEDIINETLTDVEKISEIRLTLEGYEPGSLSVYSVEDYSLELIKLAREADVKWILEILEGVKGKGLSKTRKYQPFRRGEKLGFELGSDVERAVPRELFVDDELLYYKLAQGKLLLYSKVIEESTGPIYVLVDKSGSMEGDKIRWAKALALSLYMKSIKHRREFYLRFFDSQPHGLLKLSKNPDSRDAVKIFEYIATMKSAGGTDITRAVVTALLDIHRDGLKYATLVLITDGVDRVSERPIREELAKTQSSLITVMIKGDNKNLRTISKEYLKAVKLNGDEILRVIEAVD
ncbi:MAG: VWA domain-containing protein [Desulfurococcaceae archaeon]